MYLTYEEYQSKGGMMDNTAFTRRENKASRLLDYWTQDRIIEADETVKDLIFEMVEKLSDGQQVKSFSNDGISVTLSERTEEDELYELAVAYLPAEIISMQVIS